MNEQTNPRSAGKVFGALGRMVAYLALFLGCQFLVSLLFLLVPTVDGILHGQDPYTAVGIASLHMDVMLATLVSGLLTLAVLLIVFLLRRKRPLEEVHLHKVPGKTALSALGLAPVLYLVVVLVMSLLPEAWLTDYAQAASALNETSVMAFAATALVGPVVEEVVFRGIILSRLGRAMPGWLAVVLSALVFGLCHGQAVWITYAFVLGLIFGLMTRRSGSILPSMLTHILFNTVGQTSSLLEELGIDPFVPLLAAAVVGLVVCLVLRRSTAGLFLPPKRQAQTEMEAERWS